MEMKENVQLAAFTTLGVGGPARFFCDVKNEPQLTDAVRFAQEKGLPLFVLGGGSNLVVSDAGFLGIVVRIAVDGIEREGDVFRVGAGVLWNGFVDNAVDVCGAGVECMAGIPGTVGGTPVQNVGAYGEEVSSTIVRVRAYDLAESRWVELSNAECGFGYRTSVFNTTAKGRYVVTRVDFKLEMGGKPNLKYADLAKRFAGKPEPTLREVADAVLEIRARKGMVTAWPGRDGVYPERMDTDTVSAGSFFRNPVVPAGRLEDIAAAAGVSEVPNWPTGDGMTKLPAAWLIEKAGFAKGFRMGRAAISGKHTLALTNLGGATAAEVIALRDHVAAVVRERFSVELEQEPVLVG